ncbi:MAG: CHAT domain-containing protein [Burkholderiales bacterium]|nr:CHAT domain-containing protein [Bacteroidia bacterium]
MEFINGNSEKALFNVTSSIKALESKSTPNVLLLSQHYNLAGEIYYNYSDIEEAYNYWNKSYQLIKKKYGNNSIYLSYNYSLFARYYNFKINIDSAYYFASKSIDQSRLKKDSVYLVPIHKIYREYAYALKIKNGEKDYILGREKAKIYLDSALYLYDRFFHQNNNFNAQIQHDIGNLYNDISLCYKRDLNNNKKSEEYFIKANLQYNKALKIRQHLWGTKHDKIATTYFVKALTYLYCYKYDSLSPLLKYYQKALCSLSPDYSNESIFSYPSPQTNFFNPTQVLVVLRFKTDGLYYLYKKTKDIKYLKACYEHSEISVKLWETTFKKLKTHEIHQALEVYLASPFASAILYSNEYYQLTKNLSVKENVFKWMDLNKYSTLLKAQLDNKLFSFQTNQISIHAIQSKLKINEAVIEYYQNAEGFICAVISKNKFDLYPINLTFKPNGRIDSLLLNLKAHNSNQYCKIAKSLYDSILSPYIKNLPYEINHLIIVPHDKLSKIPVDALILNNTSTYSKADFLIKRYEVSYALSCNLLNSDNAVDVLNSNLTAISPKYNLHSRLPFSANLVEDLKSDFNMSDFTLTKTNKNNSILHVGAHAFCDYQNSRSSYILVSDTEKLFLNQISNAKLNYKLAVLSACETANGDVEKGEGTISFNRHLYLAGIHSAITTLWKVDDEATASIIKSFYRELLDGNSSIKSMHNAKLAYLSNPKSVDDYDPYYWGGLIYTGNDLNFETNHYLRYSIIGLGLTLALLILFRKFRF